MSGKVLLFACRSCGRWSMACLERMCPKCVPGNFAACEIPMDENYIIPSRWTPEMGDISA